MNSKGSFNWMTVSVALGAACLLATVSLGQATGSDAKPRTVRQAVAELAKEAKEAEKNDWQWPRKEPDYAQTSGTSFDSRDVLRSLERRLDRSPAVDGYIKWQLLSYTPAIGQLDGREVVKLMRGWPELIPRPDFDRRGMAAVMAVKKKDRPSSREIEQAKQAIEELNEQIKVVEKANEPAVEYLEAVVESIPEEDGLRFLARVRLLEALARAGEGSGLSLEKKVSEEAEKRATDRSLPAAVRRETIAIFQRLEGVRVVDYRGVVAMASGEASLNDRAKFQINEKDVEKMTNWMMGKK